MKIQLETIQNMLKSYEMIRFNGTFYKHRLMKDMEKFLDIVPADFPSELRDKFINAYRYMKEVMESGIVSKRSEFKDVGRFLKELHTGFCAWEVSKVSGVKIEQPETDAELVHRLLGVAPKPFSGVLSKDTTERKEQRCLNCGEPLNAEETSCIQCGADVNSSGLA